MCILALAWVVVVCAVVFFIDTSIVTLSLLGWIVLLGAGTVDIIFRCTISLRLIESMGKQNVPTAVVTA